jgi:hypothetical protein
MLITTIEIWPHGCKDLRREIGRVKIVNDLTGTPEFGNYKVQIELDGKTVKATVKDHDRQLSPYHILYKALEKCLTKAEKRVKSPAKGKSNAQIGTGPSSKRVRR